MLAHMATYGLVIRCPPPCFSDASWAPLATGSLVKRLGRESGPGYARAGFSWRGWELMGLSDCFAHFIC